MGLAGLTSIAVKAPVTDHTALVIIETGGCFADGIRVATGATVGHRTLRVEDIGKIAATFGNLASGESVRLAPRAGIRSKASEYAQNEKKHYFAQLTGYQRMPVEELFCFQRVKLVTPAAQIMSRQNARAVCYRCGEEVINEREVVMNDEVLCRTCAFGGYYKKM